MKDEGDAFASYTKVAVTSEIADSPQSLPDPIETAIREGSFEDDLGFVSPVSVPPLSSIWCH